MAPASVRKLVLRNAQQLERVQRAVDFMNRKVGRGWPRHMEMRDRYMDQDYPRLWLSGRKIVSRRNVRRFEEYAKRFGFVCSEAELVVFPRLESVTKSLSAL